MTFRARFQKLRGELTTWEDQFSEGQGELNSQRGLDSGGLPCFSGKMFFLWQRKLFISLCIF